MIKIPTMAMILYKLTKSKKGRADELNQVFSVLGLALHCTLS